MKTLTNKSKATAIALILMFAMTISLVALPNATAQETGTFQTYAFIGATPNPVGVGQETLLHVGITRELASALYGWEGLTVEVTRPDGHTETLGPFRTDSTGGTGTVYVPTMAGNYTLQTHFPEQVIPPGGGAGFFFGSIPDGTVMLESYSDELTLVVTEEPITYYPGHALPTEYWTRPIDAQLREWYTISANWLTTPRNMWVPYNDDAPETAHILWAKPLTVGGVVGGALGDPALGALGNHAFEGGDAYEGKWQERFIIGGKLIYETRAEEEPQKEYTCVDIHTGEELWSDRVFGNNETLAYAQLMYWDTYDFHGVYDYLWTSVGGGFDFATFTFIPGVLKAYDANTGEWVYTITDLPSGTEVWGPKGEMLYYTVDTTHGYMTMWNSSNIPALYASNNYASMDWGVWQPFEKTVNGTGPAIVTIGGGSFGFPPPDPYIAPTTPTGYNGYQWNVSIPTTLPGGTIAVLDDRVIGGATSNTEVSLWGLNLDAEKGAIGSLLFENTWDAPADWAAGNLSISGAAISSFGENGVYTLWSKEERKYYGFSTETGKYLWKTSDPEYYLQIYVATSNAIVDDKLYSTGASGVLYCYDIATGEKLWEYHASDYYSEILWANDWWLAIQFITDGKIYVGHQEHSPIDPKPRGAPFVCLNATTGDVIWRADGLFRQTHWGGECIMGDSIIATMDTYDQRVYAIGRGPSATTVMASPKVSTEGSSVLVEGMVTDVSPGTNSAGLEMRFPNGVPVVSDANMSDWMLYVYKQFERPADAVGVDVIVSVIDPNNNCYEVGRTTSDDSGAYGLAFTPEVPGKYTVIASFEGSSAYYGSFAETFINVEEAPAATPAPTPTPAPMTDTYVLGIGAGAIIAIVIIGMILILMMRKR
jgi:outer membrane protein assembly factor BamB